MNARKDVYCLANNENQAEHIISRLVSNGFTNEDISILCPDKSRRNAKTTGEWDSNFEGPQARARGGDLSTEKHTKAPEGATTGATAGGVLGGTLGLLAGIGALAIPGLGPFIAAGPIMAALSGSAVGGGLGLLVGALVGAGIPEYEAKKYEDALKAGNCLICVRTENSDEINRATEIMEKEGGRDISSKREKAKSR